MPAAARHNAPEELDPQRYLAHVKFLASEAMRGRATGSPELEKAAAYIARQFKADGLQPVDGKSYLQAFQVTTSARLGPNNRFEFTEGGKITKLKPDEEFIPFNFSSKAKVSGSVVFVGYGITAHEYNYDDYAGVDVKGKLALLLRHEPQEFDEKSIFAGKVYTEHAQFFSKVVNAKNHGAIGVILINDRANHRGEGDQLETFGKTAGPADGGIPFVQIKSEVADRWIKDAGKNLDDLETDIDKDLKPRSFALPETLEVRENVDVERAVKTAHNVVGYLPGETAEYVVIGAHDDHLGLGEQFSMAPSLAGTIHPGADDNASGTAGVMELARKFGSEPKPKRGIRVHDLRRGGAGTARVELLREPSRAAAGQSGGDDQHGYDRTHPGGQGLHWRGGHGDDAAGDARPGGSQVQAECRFLRYDRLWFERSHFVHDQAGAGALFLFRLALRLSQTERYMG